MDIYTPEGDLDLEKAQRELVATRAIHNPEAKKARSVELQIATLLDLATSLRTVALEASFAMQAAGLIEVDLSAEPEPVTDETRDFLVVGDLVHVIGESEPGEVTALGFDQGDPYAVVDFAVTKGMRYFVRNLERLVGDAGDELEDGTDPDLYDAPETMRPEDGLGLVGTIGHEDALAALRDVEGDTRSDVDGLPFMIDDIDADFGGEPTPAADDALAVLKANEEKRKAAKAKKGSKK